MNNEKFDLFLVLIKLKSYLLSLVDSPEECYKDFALTEEYLDRRFPDKKAEIMKLFKEYKINSDCDIVFDEKIHEKFKKMVSQNESVIDLPTLLNKLEIDSGILIVNHEFKSVREERINEILRNLFNLVQSWAARKELENDVDDYSVLEEEEVIRPEEEKKLNKLGKYNSISFNNISVLTKEYIEFFTEYYFNYGGDINLKDFVNYVTNLKDKVSQRYYNLFKDHGLDPEILK